MVLRVVVSAALAPLHAEARVSSPQISQALGGHPLEVVESRDEWRRVRGEDGYEGWTHAGYLAPAGDLAAARPTSLGCTVRGPGGHRRRLPPGALLLPDETVESGEALAPEALRDRFPPDPAAAARTAVATFDGTPYQWGGVTPWGADCSGLVQTAFRLHGMLLPRDAWQQASVGDDAGVDPLRLAAGDLLFFSDREDRRVTHVGIALGGAGMVHAALGRGGYSVERLDDTDDLYVEKLRSRITVARRLRAGSPAS